MTKEEYAQVRYNIAHKVAQPVLTPRAKKSNIHRCEKCRKILTGGDVKAYRLESKDFGYPAVCEVCAEVEARIVPTMTVVDIIDDEE